VHSALKTAQCQRFAELGRSACRVVYRGAEWVCEIPPSPLQVHEEEMCLIPMGGVLPRHPQRTLGIGGTAGMVHPSTGAQPELHVGARQAVLQDPTACISDASPTPSCKLQAEVPRCHVAL
jgi:Lycopene cyclase protein